MFATLLSLSMLTLLQGCAHLRESRAEAAYPPTGRFVEVDGTRIHVRELGDGPDLVMIHGASGSTRDFTHAFAERMSGRYRVILMDRPGMGWSGRPAGYGGAFNTAAESPALQAAMLQRVADQIGVRNPMVLGHSYGGAVALAWALSRPEDTAALVLVSAASQPWPGELGALYQINSTGIGSAIVIPAITAFTPRPVIHSTVATVFAPQSVPEGYIEHFGPTLTLRRPTMRANAQQVNSLRPHVVEMSKRYQTLRMPVEIVHGTSDTTVPLHIHSEVLVQQIPGSVLTRLEGIGHMPHHVAPQEIDAAIDRAANRAGLR